MDTIPPQTEQHFLPIRDEQRTNTELSPMFHQDDGQGSDKCILYRIWPYLEIDLISKPVTGVTHEAGNAHTSGAPGSPSFARSSLLYWVFTGFILIFYSCCLCNDL